MSRAAQPGPPDPQPPGSLQAGGQTPFADRKTYRRRRLMDIAKLLPLFGAALFAVPLMWPGPDRYPAPDTAGGMPMSSAITYIFLVWAGLIAVSFVFGLAVQRWADHWTQEGSGPEPDAGDAKAGGEDG